MIELVPVYFPLDFYYHFKTRDLLGLMTHPLDAVSTSQQAFEAHPALFQKYREDGYCTCIWQWEKRGYHGTDALEYDSNAAVDMIVANLDQNKNIEISRNKYTEQEVADNSYDSDHAIWIYIGMVVSMCVSWELLCLFCCWCFIAKSKNWDICCCNLGRIKREKSLAKEGKIWIASQYGAECKDQIETGSGRTGITGTGIETKCHSATSG